MNEILNQEVWGNTVLSYLMVILGIFGAWLILKLIKRPLLALMKKIARKTSTNFDDLIVDMVEKFIIPYVYLFINYSLIRQLNLSQRAEDIIRTAFLFVTVYFGVRLVNFVIHRSIVMIMESKNEPPERIKQLSGMLIVVKVLMWGIGLLMLFDNLGYDVTTIIAGMGVGGIAIALAAQNILSDLFSYLVIFFDKPFEIGDFIVIGENSGNVEKIGIKTSHVRSLDGQQMVIPNAEMSKSVIHNFKRLQRRRIVFSVGVVYYTPARKLRNIPAIVKSVIDRQENATFDRAHLKSFGDFSVNFELVYYVESPEYITYMNCHHFICLRIFERFEEEGIEFAFPTQTLFIGNQNGSGQELKEYAASSRSQ